MKYRPHKGSFAESYLRTVEVDGRAGLIRHLRQELDGWQVDVPDEAVRVVPYAKFDHIAGWKDVHIVTSDGYGVMGICEGTVRVDPDDLPEDDHGDGEKGNSDADR
jgi:hypothetical protein